MQRGQRRLSPDEAARYLFRKVVSWGRSSNVFLQNGARLYLDVGSHPEYATPECDDPRKLVAADKAGERILQNLAVAAAGRLEQEGITGEIYLFKNNTDSAGNSYGCHENYLLARDTHFPTVLETLIPFLVSRQVFAGAGRLATTSRGTRYVISQRADHLWESASSATTRSRPIINTRDEPHADADTYRRLHVIAGDSNMGESPIFVKVAIVGALLEMLEAGVVFRDLTLENPIRAIRAISNDLDLRQEVRLVNGRRLSALDIQWEYLEAVRRFERTGGFAPVTVDAIRRWERLLSALEGDPRKLVGEVDWITKRWLLDEYRGRHGVPWTDPRLQRIDLAYHDIDPNRGLYQSLVRKGLTVRMVKDEEIAAATDQAPCATRARLRARFITAAKAAGRDITVDWVHLKVNDQAQRTITCKDPFSAEDVRVERLIRSF